MLLEGIASTDKADRSGEVVDIDGIDYSGFLKEAVVNWGHQRDADSQIGCAVAIEKVNTKNRENKACKGLKIKVKLFPEIETAQKVYTLAKALEKQNHRGLGLSVELDVKSVEVKTEADGSMFGGKKVLKETILTGLAITPIPANRDTGLIPVEKSIENVCPIKNVVKDLRDGSLTALRMKAGEYGVDKDFNIKYFNSSCHIYGEVNKEKENPEFIHFLRQVYKVKENMSLKEALENIYKENYE